MLRMGHGKYRFFKLARLRSILSNLVNCIRLYFFILYRLSKIFFAKTVLLFEWFSLIHLTLMNSCPIKFLSLTDFTSCAFVSFAVVTHSELFLSESRREDSIELDLQLYFICFRLWIWTIYRFLLFYIILSLSHDYIFAVDDYRTFIFFYLDLLIINLGLLGCLEGWESFEDSLRYIFNVTWCVRKWISSAWQLETIRWQFNRQHTYRISDAEDGRSSSVPLIA